MGINVGGDGKDGGPRRMSAQTAAKTARKLDEEIDENDFLDEEQEAGYMQTLVDVVQGKIQAINEEERTALVAIRKEYLRRNLSIEKLFKDVDKLDKYVDVLEGENNDLTDYAIKKVEVANSLQRTIN